MYKTLDADKIIATIERLRRRIDERFPGGSLSGVAGELEAVAIEAKTEAAALGRPNLCLQLTLVGIILAGGLVFIFVGTFINFSRITTEATDFVQAFEAAINTAVFAGLGIVFLATLQDRWRRRVALRSLHRLRSVIHVIDMHQLTKDPGMILGKGQPTASSPRREMSAFELTRYLDYCSEMLSLCGKVAALYVQELPDAVVIEAVNDIEMLSTNLSRKIWQKIMILHRYDEAGAPL